MNTPYKSHEISDWILTQINTEAGDTISPLKLQKLLYYAQAWHYTLFNKPLYFERIEAWAHGPVVPSQYYRFNDYARDFAIPIKSLGIQSPEIDKDTEDFLNDVMLVYGEHSAQYLENLTHCEDPWREARKGLEPHERSNNEITLESMKRYYSSKV